MILLTMACFLFWTVLGGLLGAGGNAISGELTVALPQEVRPLPEPLPQGQQPGFKIRGIKGWAWEPEQYLEEIPVLAKYKMNFLMNCYLSMFTEYRDDANWKNEWWLPLPEAKKQAYEGVVRECQKHGIQFCFCMNPNIASKRFVRADPRDLDDLWQHYAWMQSLGVKWFSVSLDDIEQGIDAAMQAQVVNEMLRRLQLKDPAAQMIFCPTYYAGDGTGNNSVQSYNTALASALHPDVYLFWTGDTGIAPRVTRRAAESFRQTLKHRVILWDNYPVNNGYPVIHLGPVTGRDSDLGEVLDGYMGNPLRQQNQINRIPLLTCADYAYNPKAYDPLRSIGQAIVHLAETPEQRQAMKELVEAYPGNLICGGDVNANPVRKRFQRIASADDSRTAAEAYLRNFEALMRRFRQAFPDRFADATEMLDTDMTWLTEAFDKRYK